MLTTWQNPNPPDVLSWIGRVVTTVAYLETGYEAWVAGEGAKDWYPQYSKANWVRSMRLAFTEADRAHSPTLVSRRKAADKSARYAATKLAAK